MTFAVMLVDLLVDMRDVMLAIMQSDDGSAVAH